MSKVEKKVEPTPPLEILPLKVNSVHIEHYGHSFKTAIIHLPPDYEFAWINEKPEMFRLIQKDRQKALAEYDKVELRGRDYTIFACVNYADAEKVYFYDVRRAAKPQRDVPLYADNLYEVRWAQKGGFAYYRRSDGVQMGAGTYPTPEAAKSALIRNEYPVQR